MMDIQAFRAKLAEAKQVQAASSQNPNLRDHVGEQLVVVGMHITEGIEIDNLVIDKVTFALADGTAIDGFHQAAVDKADDLISVLGEGPYPMPLLMEVCETETKRGPKQYARLIDFYGTEADMAFADLEQEVLEEKTISDDTPVNTPDPTPPAEDTPPVVETPPATTSRTRRTRAAK